MGEPGFERLRNKRPSVLGDGPNLYGFVRNDAIDLQDPFGLKIDEAFCGAWFNDCVAQATKGFKSCIGECGLSFGNGIPVCLALSLPCLRGGPYWYGGCFVACAGIDTIVWLKASSYCRNAFADASKSCADGYDRCLKKADSNE